MILIFEEDFQIHSDEDARGVWLAGGHLSWRNPDAGLSTLATPFTIEPLGIALPADDPLFLNLVENYLNTLEGTGLLTAFKAKWFSDGSWLNELP